MAMDILSKYPKRKRTWLERIKSEARQFCLNTALHGYRFIVLPKRILLERVAWIVVCFIALTIALTLLFLAWFNFKSNPTILVTDSNHYPIWNYPFPAVTVCNFNKISKKKILQLASTLIDPGQDKKKIEELASDMRIIFQLIKNTHIHIPAENYTRIQDLLDKKRISVNSLLDQLAPTCTEMIVRCLWKGEEKKCSNMFERIKCVMGYCCTFNYFAMKNNSFNANAGSKVQKEPQKVSACGPQTALEIMVDNNPDDDFASFTPSTGHNIVLHYSYHFPDWNVQAMLSEIKTVNLVSINPSITYSDGIEELPVDVRRCLFPHEKELIYFSQYNFHNCMVECRMNLTRKLCHCTPFYNIQDQSKSSKQNICNLRDMDCLSTNEHLIRSSVPGFDFFNISPKHIFGTEKGECNCLPDCEGTEYLAESSSGVLNRKFSLNKPSMYGGIQLQNHSIIRVFFNDLVGTRNRRYVKFDWHTLLAYYGGLLGLFLGFSFVSGIEIVYFFTVRLVAGDKKKINVNNLQHSQVQKVKPATHDSLYPRNLMYHANVKKRNHLNLGYIS